MKPDPHSHAARRLVRLVIVAVALPSLLLTGLGMIAINSEHAAAKQRLEEAYKPVLKASAGRFNASIHDLDASTAEPLSQLVAGSKERLETTPTALREFIDSHPQATNYFVLVDHDMLPWQADPRPLPERAQVALTALDDDLRRPAGAESPGFLTHIQTLALAVADPTRASLDPEQAGLVARVRDRLVQLSEPAALRAAIALETVLEREALYATIARRGFSHDGQPDVVNVVVNDWRRVLFVRRVGDAWAGFELAMHGFTELLDGAVAELELDDEAVSAVILPVQFPKSCSVDKHKLEQADVKVLTWALLTQSQLAWEMSIIYSGEAPLVSLDHNRSLLYLWALALCVLALAFGIVLTLRTVAREARYARLKTDFVSSVSHDLRTPLTSIRMFTETLLMGRVRDREEELECLHTIAHETERLTRLTERILDFSRMEAGRKAYALVPADLGSIVERSVAACKPLIEEHGAVVRVEVAPSLPPAEVDADAMTELVVNLLTNAIKYSLDRREIDVRLRQEGEELVLEVADHGIGIARAEREKIFEKFYRVDCRRTTEVDGSGIGLSLVRHIVDAHRGRVVLESAEGVGSTFSVHLPAAAWAADGGRMERILVVEDDPSIARGIVRNLRFEGYSVELASNGQSGLEQAVNCQPDLMLLDVMLPQLNGFEVLRELRRLEIETPVIMLTAKAEEIDRVRGLDLGADDYVTKPFSLPELLARVRAALRRQRQATQKQDQTSFGAVEVDFVRCRVAVNGETVKLTRRELGLLRLFVERDGQVLEREEIIRRVWGYDYEGTDRTLDNFVSRLRHKLEADSSKPQHFLTIRGIGYQFVSRP